MLCGSKCLQVKMELVRSQHIKQVTARNAIGARKAIRGEYGDDAKIVSVREEKKNL